MTDITDYDRSGYDYKGYWNSRQYEDLVERQVLNRFLPSSGKRLVDLGGGYGRLAELYLPRFEKNILFDYSQKLLSQAEKRIKQEKIKNLKTVQGDIYSLPFNDQEFDTVLMIRVVHHLQKPQKAIQEVSRVLKSEGVFILEFANKCHLKARLKHCLKGDRKFCLDLAPYEQSAARGNLGRGIFYNYHPQHIEQMLKNAGFVIEKKISVSNLRSPFLKRILPLSLMLLGEKILQPLFSPFNFGPSIFLRCRKTA